MQISSNLHSNVSRSTRINSSSVHTYIFVCFTLRVFLQGFVTQNATLPSNIRTICLEDSNKQKLLPQHKYNTRTRSIPNFPKATTKLYKNSFLYKGPRSVLSVETEVQKASTLGIFIGKCKQTLLNKYVK